jgi:hypothetical protein
MILPCFIAGCTNKADLVLKTPSGETKYKPLCDSHYTEIKVNINKLKNIDASGHGTPVIVAFIKAAETASTITIEEYNRILGA